VWLTEFICASKDSLGLLDHDLMSATPIPIVAEGSDKIQQQIFELVVGLVVSFVIHEGRVHTPNVLQGRLKAFESTCTRGRKTCLGGYRRPVLTSNAIDAMKDMKSLEECHRVSIPRAPSVVDEHDGAISVAGSENSDRSAASLRTVHFILI